MNSISVSLIIPAHNEEKCLASCLDAALENGLADLCEILIIDNASTDKTAEIASSYAASHQKIRVIREDRKGPSFARERGFREASGEILAFIDADTRMPPGWTKKICSAFSKDPNLACFSGPYVYFDIPKWQSFLVMLWNMIPVIVSFFGVPTSIGGNLALRKSVLERMGGFDTSIDFYGDDTNIPRRAKAFGKTKFDPTFVMYTSGRRLAGQGLLKTAFLYGVNFLSEQFLKKPVTKSHSDIR